MSSWAVFNSTGDELIYIDQAESGYVLRRFHLDPDELIELAETRVTRGLTAEECRRYELGVEACASPGPLTDLREVLGDPPTRWVFGSVEIKLVSSDPTLVPDWCPTA